jgi:hypothetical protein
VGARSYTSTTKKALWRYRQLLAKRCLLNLGSLKRVSPCIECWSLRQIQCRILLPYWVRVESFQVIEPASSYLGCPFLPDILHVIFVWTQISPTPADIFCAGSVVRLGLVFNYNCKSAFLQQVGWERCPVFRRTLKSGPHPERLHLLLHSKVKSAEFHCHASYSQNLA